MSSSRVLFLTSDGVSYLLTDNTTNEQGNIVPIKFIYVDINGAKGPNTFGIDVFQFWRVAGRGILPMGYNDLSNVDKNCNKTGAGSYCAMKIMRDGWKITYTY